MILGQKLTKNPRDEENEIKKSERENQGRLVIVLLL